MPTAEELINARTVDELAAIMAAAGAAPAPALHACGGHLDGRSFSERVAPWSRRPYSPTCPTATRPSPPSSERPSARPDSPAG
ncbi:hypothetical protein [Streptomyces vilmorinianum]|uniref:hypothetical protein n=1 Tax=Streptomyces vilmorinianum TaxID=3051092 RepID=UPI0020C830CF|nr:hypothetical protein [Streptomyces vilmorinianum]